MRTVMLTFALLLLSHGPAQAQSRTVRGRLMSYDRSGITIQSRGRQLLIPVHPNTTVRVHEEHPAPKSFRFRRGQYVTVWGDVRASSILQNASVVVHTNPKFSVRCQTHTSETRVGAISQCNARVVSTNPLIVTSIDTFEFKQDLKSRNYTRDTKLVTSIRNKSFVVQLKGMDRVSIKTVDGIRIARPGDKVEATWTTINGVYPSSVTVKRPEPQLEGPLPEKKGGTDDA